MVENGAIAAAIEAATEATEARTFDTSAADPHAYPIA